MDEQKTLRRRAVRKGLAAAAFFILCWVGSILADHIRPLRYEYHNWLLIYRVLPAIGTIGGTVSLAWKGFAKLGISLLTTVVLWCIGIVIYAFVAIEYIYPYADLSYLSWFIGYHSFTAKSEFLLACVLLAVIFLVQTLPRYLGKNK